MGWLVRLRVSEDVADLVTSRLWDLGPNGVLDEGTAGVEGSVVVVAGFADRRRAQRAAAELSQVSGVVAPVRVEPAPLPERWAPASGPGPVSVTGRDGRSMSLAIDAGPTFGHGRHPSTRLALDHVGAVVRPGQAVLDVGTGSGVLAVAASLLGAEVWAIDVDPVAVDVALVNAAANGCTIHCSTAGVSAVARQQPSGFDVVAANLLLPDHHQLAPAIVAALAPSGVIVTSGHLVSQAASVTAAYDPLAPLQRRRRADWEALLLGWRSAEGYSA